MATNNKGRANTDKEAGNMQLDFQRYEYKYIIPDALCPAIADFVQCYVKPDPASARSPDGRYFIYSLYLDSPYLTCHLAKSRKQRNRFKLRIRTYGPDADGPIFFEIKRKIKDVIFKRRVQAHLSDWTGHSPGSPQLLFAPNSRNVDVMREFMQLAEREAMAPQSLIRYTREAYESTIDDYSRVTFDRYVACHEPVGYALQVPATQWIPLDDPIVMEASAATILELKFAGRAPQWMFDLVHRFGLQRRGFSKYSTAVQYSMDNHRIPLAGRCSTVFT